MRTAIERFIVHLDRERNASPHTVRAYGEDVAQYADHLRAQIGREPRPEDADHLSVRAFLAALHASGLRRTSAARKLASLRTFFRYLCREGVLERNPAAPSGFRWSSSTGPSVKISSGTLATGDVVVREEAPINLLIPKVREKLGF